MKCSIYLSALLACALAACGSPLNPEEAPDMAQSAPVQAAVAPIPCPDDMSVDRDKREFSLNHMLAAHPNPACSRDWVCTPITTTWTSLPLCRWSLILKGDEAKTVWISLSAPSGVIVEAQGRETTSRSISAQTYRTSTWTEYTDKGEADRVTTLEASQPGVPADAEGIFERLRLTATRTFESKPCPRAMPTAKPYNANCGIWLP